MFKNSRIEVLKTDYTEPNQELKFLVHDNNTDINIIADFGDTSKLFKTKLKTIHHSYKKEGLYVAQFHLYLGCQSNNITLKVLITIGPIIIPLEDLRVTSVEHRLGLETILTMTMKKGNFYNCMWKFGDGSSFLTTYYSNSNQTHVVKHLYTTAKLYKGSVTCSNRKNRLDKQFICRIQKKISGLIISKIKPRSSVTPFVIRWFLIMGSDPEYSVTVNNQVVNYTVNGNRMEGEVFIDSTVLRGRQGVYNLRIDAKNEASGVVTADSTFVIYPEINTFNITVPKTAYEINETILLGVNIVNKPFHGYPRYIWSFGDGSDSYETNKFFIRHKYQQYGRFIVAVTIFNPASNQSGLTTIKVVKPVIALYDIICYMQPTKLGDETVLSCLLGEGSEFKCLIYWDNESITTNDLTYLQYEPSLSKSNFKNIIIKSKHTFKKPGSYKVYLTCANRLSKVTYQTSAIVQTPITGLQILFLQSIVFGDEFRVQWKIEHGSNVSVKSYWDNKAINHNVVCKIFWTRIKPDDYKIDGIHKFTVYTSNMVSNVNKSLSVIIEKPVKQLSLWMKHDVIEINEINEFRVDVDSGSTLSYLFEFGDMTKKTALSSRIQHHSYSSHGRYNVKVTAYNTVSRSSVQRIVTVQKPVLKLANLTFRAKPANVSSNIQFVGFLKYGSDFICIISYGDGNTAQSGVLYEDHYSKSRDKFYPLSIAFEHAYDHAQDFVVSLECKNRLNSISVSNVVGVYTPVVPFRIFVENTHQQNIPILFKLSNENELNMAAHKYQIDFGDNSEILFTNELQFFHVYARPGRYNISAIVLNSVSKLIVGKNIQILATVLKLSGLSIEAVPTIVSEPTILKVLLRKGSNFNCSIQWTADRVELIDRMNISHDSNVHENIIIYSKNIFKTKGKYPIEVTCWNRLSKLFYIVFAIVQEPLKGFNLRPILPQIFGSNFYLACNIESDKTDFQFQLQWNGTVQNTHIGRCNFLISPKMYHLTGSYFYSITGSNKVMPPIQLDGQVSIEKEIKYLEVIVNKNDKTFEVNDLVIINVTTITGSNIHYNIDYGDGSILKNVIQPSFMHFFSKPGLYKVTIFAFNNVSQIYKTIPIKIEDPVLQIYGLTILSPPNAQLSEVVQFVVNIQIGSHFLCMISFGDGCELYSYFESSVAIKPKKQFSNISVTFDHAYGRVNKYAISVECSNRLSNVLTSQVINIYKPVVHFTISVQPEHEIGRAVIFRLSDGNQQINMQNEYMVNFGDFVNTLVSKNLQFSHGYSTFGMFNVSVTAFNPVSKLTKYVNVHILKPVLNLQGISGKASPVNKTDTTSLQINIKQGSNFNCSIKWKPNHEKIINQMDSGVYIDIKIIEKYRFQEIGKYTINIKCWNRLSVVSLVVESLVQQPLKGLFLLPISPKVFGESFFVECDAESGSDLIFQLKYNKTTIKTSDGSCKFLITSNIYISSGVHLFIITAFNAVTPPVTLSHRVIVESKIVSLLLITIKTFEVNEIAIIHAIAKGGSRRLYNIDYGDGTAINDTNISIFPHAFQLYGEYTVSVTAHNSVSKIVKVVHLSVIKPVLTLSRLQIISPFFVNVSETVHGNVLIGKGSDLQCNVSFGDGNIYQSEKLFDNYNNNNNNKRFSKKYVNFTHSYSRSGRYKIISVCSNSISWESAIRFIFVYHPVVEFSISVHQAQLQNSLVEFNISDENEQNKAKHKYEVIYGAEKKIIKTNQFFQTYSQFGIYNVSVTAFNRVSRLTIIKTITILKRVIQLKGLSASTTPVNLHTHTELKVVLQEGSDLNCSIQWEKDHVIIINQYSKEKLFQEIEIVRRYKYSKDGCHRIKITCYNRLNIIIVVVYATVNKPLANFYMLPLVPKVFGSRFFTQCYRETVKEEVHYKLRWKKNKSSYKTNSCTFLITPEMYSNPGHYLFSVVSINSQAEVVERSGEITIERVIKSLSLRVLNSTNLEVNETFEILVVVNGGSNLIYDVNYDDGTILADLTKASFSHFYRKQGHYKVQVSVYNNLSLSVETILLSVKKPVIPLRGLRFDNKFHVAIAEPEKFIIMLDQGSDFQCSINFGDGEKLILPYQFSYNYIDYQKLPMKYNDIKFIVNHTYSKQGFYVVVIVCYNRLSISNATLKIATKFKLTHFTVTSKVQQIELNEIIEFVVSIIVLGVTPKFHVSFGDGTSDLLTLKTRFNHTFTRNGIFLVTVIATTPFGSHKEQIQVKVLKPVLLLKDLSLFAEPTVFSKETVLYLNIKEGSDFNCSLEWGDLGSIYTTLYWKYMYFNSEQSLFQNISFKSRYLYNKVGVYKINVKCFNRLNTVKSSISIAVQEKISELILHNVQPQSMGSSFQITWAVATGTDIKYIVKWQGIVVAHETRDNLGFTTISPNQCIEEGIYRYQVEAYNKVTKPITKTGTVVLQHAFKDLNITTQKSIIEVNETIKINIVFKSKVAVPFEYFKSDTSNPIKTLQTFLKFHYSVHGNYTFKVKAQNNVSTESAVHHFSVLKPVLPITKITLFVEPNADVYSDVVLTVNIQKGSDFKCSIDHGDKTENRSKLLKTNYYGWNVQKFQNISYDFIHQYNLPKLYTVNVQCSNRLSVKTVFSKVTIEAKISALKVTHISPQSVGAFFTIAFKVGHGSNITYSVLFLGQKLMLYSDTNTKQSVTLRCNVSGVHPINITAFNKISYISKDVVVTIEHPITNLRILTPLPGLKFELSQQLNICYAIDTGSNPTFNVVLGDGEIKTTTALCITQEFKLDYYFKYGEVELLVTIVVVAYNNINKLIKVVHFILQKPVLKLSIDSFKCLPAKTKEESILKVKINEGSDFYCIWMMGEEKQNQNAKQYIYNDNGNANRSHFQNMEITHKKIFSKPGVYPVQAYCENRLNFIAEDALCYVEDPILGFTVSKLNTQRLGSSPKINWFITSGTNVRFHAYLNGVKLDHTFIGLSGFVMIPSYMISAPGLFNGSISAVNRVTKNITILFMLNVEKVIKSMNVSIWYSGANDTKKGLEANNSYYPLYEVIYFHIMKLYQGVRYKWEIRTENGSLQATSTENLFLYTFKQPGNVIVKYRAFNNVSNIDEQKEIMIIQTVKHLHLESDAPKAIAKPVTFTITAIGKGKQSCFRLSPGDGTDYFFYTEQGNCHDFYKKH